MENRNYKDFIDDLFKYFTASKSDQTVLLDRTVDMANAVSIFEGVCELPTKSTNIEAYSNFILLEALDDNDMPYIGVTTLQSPNVMAFKSTTKLKNKLITHDGNGVKYFDTNDNLVYYIYSDSNSSDNISVISYEDAKKFKVDVIKDVISFDEDGVIFIKGIKDNKLVIGKCDSIMNENSSIEIIYDEYVLDKIIKAIDIDNDNVTKFHIGWDYKLTKVDPISRDFILVEYAGSNTTVAYIVNVSNPDKYTIQNLDKKMYSFVKVLSDGYAIFKYNDNFFTASMYDDIVYTDNINSDRLLHIETIPGLPVVYTIHSIENNDNEVMIRLIDIMTNNESSYIIGNIPTSIHISPILGRITIDYKSTNFTQTLSFFKLYGELFKLSSINIITTAISNDKDIENTIKHLESTSADFDQSTDLDKYVIHNFAKVEVREIVLNNQEKALIDPNTTPYTISSTHLYNLTRMKTIDRETMDLSLSYYSRYGFVTNTLGDTYTILLDNEYLKTNNTENNGNINELKHMFQ